MPKGMLITSGMREIIFKVKEFFLKEKQLGGPIIPFAKVNERVAAATGVSMHTISNITVEGKLAQALGTKIGTPKEKRKPRKDKIIMSDFDQGVLRRKINEFNLLRKERPTLKKLYEALKAETDFKGSREIVRQYIKKSGFQYKKLKSDRVILVDTNEKKADQGKCQMQSETIESCAEEAEDTPKDISEWVTKRLGPYLEESSTDSSLRPNLMQYRVPNTNDKKGDIKKWLMHHNIEFSPDCTRTQLLEIVKSNLKDAANTVDAVLNVLGHKEKGRSIPTVPGWGEDDSEDNYSKYLQLKKQFFRSECVDTSKDEQNSCNK